MVVDIRIGSPNFKKWISLELRSGDGSMLWIPPGFAHGFACLDKINTVIYSCTNYRDKDTEQGILWNDKSLKIKWPIKKPIISKKDKLNPEFKDFV